MYLFKILNEVMLIEMECKLGCIYINKCVVFGLVEFKVVDFWYLGVESDSLKVVLFKVGVGEMVGLIGWVGFGKSIIGWLMLGLYYLIDGMVFIDGIDIW